MNHKIKFENINFDAILCLNGEISHFEYINESKGRIYCADGAANKLIEQNIIPDYIIGDLDSIDINKLKLNHPKIHFYQFLSQETNDFEKCLKFLNEQNKKNILLFGMQGGELEHTLNNWSVLKRYSNILNLIVLHNDRYAFVVRQNIEISLEINETISIIPQPICTLKSSGLIWNLNNEKLELGKREGARNSVKSQNVSIELIEGEYLLFINSRYPEVVI